MTIREQLRRRILPVAIAALLVSGGGEAIAASAPQQRTGDTSSPTKLNAVVVTGIRASLESAENRKRYAPQIMESIVAQNIGKLPDTNAADALQRITGVQAVQD